MLWGLVCLLIAAALFAVGVPFAQAWLAILGLPHGPTTFSKPCGTVAPGNCYETIVNVWVPPSPDLLLTAYAIAIPLVLLVALAIHRALRSQVAEGRRGSSLDRIACASLVAAMGGFGLVILIAFGMASFSIVVPYWMRYLWLGSLLLVPGVVASVGGAYLLTEARRGARERRPVAPG